MKQNQPGILGYRNGTWSGIISHNLSYYVYYSQVISIFNYIAFCRHVDRDDRNTETVNRC